MFIPSQISEFGHKVLISLNVFPSHPALVAKGFIVFPDKSFWFKNVLIAGTGLYHHTGVPSIISSYLLKSMPIFSFYSLSYSSSVTFSHHSLLAFSPDTSIAK
mgnify:CR=1 FL=1